MGSRKDDPDSCSPFQIDHHDNRHSAILWWSVYIGLIGDSTEKPPIKNNMSEPYYSVICWGIRLGPMFIMGVLWLICYYYFVSHGRTLLLTLAIGYLSGIVSVWVYWEFAGAYAPTEAIADEILSKDGAPRMLAPFVMPIFVGIYFLAMWPFTWLVTRLFPRFVTAEVR